MMFQFLTIIENYSLFNKGFPELNKKEKKYQKMQEVRLAPGNKNEKESGHISCNTLFIHLFIHIIQLIQTSKSNIY